MTLLNVMTVILDGTHYATSKNEAMYMTNGQSVRFYEK